MQTLLYFIWFAIPTLFFFLALWAKLEKASGAAKNDNPKDLFNQGLFTLGCVILCLIIDKLFLADVVEAFLGDVLPLGFYQAFLLPFVLLVAAKTIGPSKRIMIPHGTGNKSRRRRR